MPESQTITLKESKNHKLSTLPGVDYQPFNTVDSKRVNNNDQVHSSINDYLKEEEISKI